MVTVTSATQGPPQSLFPLWQCAPTNGKITLGCVTRDLASADGLTFSWKDPSGNAISSFVQYPAVQANGGYTSVSHLQIDADKWDKKEKYTCEVKNSLGAKKADLQKPEVLELPATLLLTAPTQTALNNGTATFICLASEFSPKTHTFKWSLDTKDFTSKARLPIISKDQKTYTAVSVLEMDSQEWTSSAAGVKCEFKQTNLEAQTREAVYVVPDVQEPVTQVTPPSTRDMLINRSGELVCKGDGDPGFTDIKWFDGNKELVSITESNKPINSTIKARLRINYTEWTSGSTFICQVSHSSFPTGFKEIHYKRENGQKTCPKIYLLPPPEISNDYLTLTCYVKDFYPKEVAVSWLVDDQKVESLPGYVQNTTNIIERDNLFSAYSQLIIKAADWNKGAVFTCRVHHESIEDHVRVLTRCISSNSNPPAIMNLSLNVPSVCNKK